MIIDCPAASIRECSLRPFHWPLNMPNVNTCFQFFWQRLDTKQGSQNGPFSEQVNMTDPCLIRGRQKFSSYWKRQKSPGCFCFVILQQKVGCVNISECHWLTAACAKLTSQVPYTEPSHSKYPLMFTACNGKKMENRQASSVFFLARMPMK